MTGGGGHAYDEDRDDADGRRPRRGPLSRIFGLIKLALFLTPLAIFVSGYVVSDCGARGGTGIGAFLKAGACARSDLLGSALTLPDNLAVLRRAMN